MPAHSPGGIVLHSELLERGANVFGKTVRESKEAGCGDMCVYKDAERKKESKAAIRLGG